MLTKALLITLVAIIATVDYNGPLFMLHRPLVTGAMTGLVLGDVQQGLMIGATLELTWLGVTGIGGYTPPDTISGAIVGTALAIMSGQGVTAGVAIAVPVAIVTQQLDTLAKTADIYFVKKADTAAKTGDIDKVDRYHYLSLILITLFKIVPIFLAIVVGGEYVKQLFDTIPPIVMTGLSAGGAMLPAIGFGMLLTMLLKKNMWVFLLIGFIASVYGGLSAIGMALVAIAVVGLLQLISLPGISGKIQNSEVSDENGEEYDL
ncbi:PTS system, mannose-specific IIC component/PTS system, fructoselysine and glucoselysine-specific IIC component [Granulicatella balaenopterae]|uniref:PTS system, mannose-specific IIC component/PTS system, fructoselysine and glucoselysine-specific IIC component n=2 Tax=Granulicatella balaenopterae TaxID=137733 RepID=A0A1H9J0Q4_9LACT|nr:PTS system, mannose-specific IIC component/PTS system, fructoselysine and glucoselysine-specific IIC component [Granulicatella balaenopterae]